MKEFENRIDQCIDLIQKYLNESEQLMPMAHLITDADEFYLIALDFSDLVAKDFSTNKVRDLAKEKNAKLVVFYCESWMIPPDKSQHFMANRDQYPEVKDYPLALECVLITVETRTNCWFASPIIIGKKGKRSLGRVDFTEPKDMTGRITNFIEREETKTKEGK